MRVKAPLFFSTRLTTWLCTALLALPAAAQTQPSDDDLPVADVQTFAEVFERIKRAYVDDVDDSTLLHNAMRGMLSELDPHSTYLDPQEFQSLKESTEGEFGGIGIEVGMRDGQLMVIAPIDDTPAARAGLQSQDAILRIDDTATDGLSLQEAVELMRGEPGSEIRITILRSGESMPRDLTLTRQVIRTESVKHEFLAPGYGYLRLSQFQSSTGEQVNDALADMQEDGGLDGLVLDLRNNPGGVLQAAVEVVDAFVNQGLIVYTEGRLADSQMSFSAHGETAAPDVPVVVLINGGSASASEIVAGALQDQRRAVIMGTESFGKGSVQQIMPLGNGDGLKLTTALYFTPNGRSIQALGITPDVQVLRGRLEVTDSPAQRLREADLSGHLQGNGDSAIEAATSPRVREDYQLGEALNLLKALKVLGPRAER